MHLADAFIQSDLKCIQAIDIDITCSPMDPLQWMGAVTIRLQTADKNITIIQTIAWL